MNSDSGETSQDVMVYEDALPETDLNHRQTRRGGDRGSP
jgi:hypothetical protein